MNSTLRQVGGAIAVAALGSVLSTSYTDALRPALTALPARQAAIARASVTLATGYVVVTEQAHRRHPGPARTALG